MAVEQRLRAGERYVRYSPVVRRILVRSALFLVPASALWALLPVVASQRLGLGANGYGLLLGALGVGAVAGAFMLPRIRAKLSSNTMLLIASLVYAAALVALVLVPNAAVILVVLVATGIAWIAVLSSMNAAMQLFLPAWVRARGLSNGALRCPGRGCRDLGCHGRAGGTRGDFSYRSGGHGRRDSDHPSLAPPRHERHRPQPGGLHLRLKAQPLTARAEAQSAPGLTRSG